MRRRVSVSRHRCHHCSVRKLPACELLFEWKGGYCTAHTVSFANGNGAILNAKANVGDPPGLTH